MRCVDALMKASVLVNADLSTESALRRIIDGPYDKPGRLLFYLLCTVVTLMRPASSFMFLLDSH
jgi:hypothetical protein